MTIYLRLSLFSRCRYKSEDCSTLHIKYERTYLGDT